MIEANIPRRTPVTSSQIAAVGYDPAAQVLEVEFRGGQGAPGAVYRYRNVSPAEHEALLVAPSPGKHFARTIKAAPQRHPFERVAPPPATD